MTQFAEFWMVFVETGSGPTRRHETASSAEQEATRLAVKHNCKAYVLKAIALCQPVPNVQWQKSVSRDSSSLLTGPGGS